MARSVKRDDIQFPPKHSALRDDVHVLGALVGDVLKEQGGDALFDLVEKDRRLSIRRRAGDKEAAAELSVQLRGRAPQVARDLARAFSMWFRAVNLARRCTASAAGAATSSKPANARSRAASKPR
jgi:phosphoenolpyruvate carboxylase